jgi:hypothetical protein
VGREGVARRPIIASLDALDLEDSLIGDSVEQRRDQSLQKPKALLGSQDQEDMGVGLGRKHSRCRIELSKCSSSEGSIAPPSMMRSAISPRTVMPLLAMACSRVE